MSVFRNPIHATKDHVIEIDIKKFREKHGQQQSSSHASFNDLDKFGSSNYIHLQEQGIRELSQNTKNTSDPDHAHVQSGKANDHATSVPYQIPSFSLANTFTIIKQIMGCRPDTEHTHRRSWR
jgi:hypothetical protein